MVKYKLLEVSLLNICETRHISMACQRAISMLRKGHGISIMKLFSTVQVSQTKKGNEDVLEGGVREELAIANNVENCLSRCKS